MNHLHRKATPGYALLLAAALLLPVPAAGAEPTQDEGEDRAARRQQMIEACQANRGVDCETEVDIELGAENYDGTRVYHPDDAPGTPVIPRPRPRPR